MDFTLHILFLILLLFVIIVCVTSVKTPTTFPSTTHELLTNEDFPFPTFIISLDTHPERYNAVAEQLKQNGIVGTRWPAVNGYQTSAKEMMKMGLSYHFAQQLGFAGCSCSHINLWKHIVNNKLGWTLILEDDAYFHSEFKTLFPLYWNELPQDALIVFPGHCKSDKLLTNSKEELVINITPWCLHAYMISEVGAQYLLDNLVPLNEIIDNAIVKHFNQINNRGVYIFNGNAIVNGVCPHDARNPCEDGKGVVFDGIVFQNQGEYPTTLNYPS